MELLVGSNEVAQLLGFRNPQTVHYYKNHDPTFPRPVVSLGGDQRRTNIWYLPEVERWARRTGRLPKLPRRPRGGEPAESAEQTG